MKDVFTKIYDDNWWNNQESVSWSGSTNEQTKKIIKELPNLFSEFKIYSMLDLPCWDFNRMYYVPFRDVEYIGADIVDDLIKKNRDKYPSKKFIVLDLATSILPRVDLIFVRDCLVHLCLADVIKALRNICESGSKYLLVTTFPEHKEYIEIPTGSWRTLNFQQPPFNFPKPIAIINEWCTEANGMYTDKSLWLWEISTIYELLDKIWK